MLSRVKKAMGITSNAFDADILGLINAAENDLRIAGAEMSQSRNIALAQQAIIFYCKGYFRADEQSESYKKAYESTKNVLSIVGGFDG